MRSRTNRGRVSNEDAVEGAIAIVCFLKTGENEEGEAEEMEEMKEMEEMEKTVI